MNVCLGGTFDPLHRGHRLLIDTASGLLAGDRLYLGLTCDELAVFSRNGEAIRSYEQRKSALQEYLVSKKLDFKIIKIDNRSGIADTDPVLDAIVVSKETYPQARAINDARAANGLNELSIFVVNFVKGDRGSIISGTLIRRGEMDPDGIERGGG